jgi:homogentisate solanesyltransferase
MKERRRDRRRVLGSVFVFGGCCYFGGDALLALLPEKQSHKDAQIKPFMAQHEAQERMQHRVSARAVPSNFEKGENSNVENAHAQRNVYESDTNFNGGSESSTTNLGLAGAAAGVGLAASASAKLESKTGNAFWRFLRPHTIRGTVLGCLAISLKLFWAYPDRFTSDTIYRTLMGLVALLLANGYIVGINQIYDVDIDVINKPFLPIAAGDLGSNIAWVLIMCMLGGGLAVVSTVFPGLLFRLYAIGLALGTMYSVPPLRLKRFPILAFLIIAVCRGFFLNFGVHYAVRASLGLPFVWSNPVTFITAFMVVFAVTIAITKDLPDAEGDRKFGISTFTTQVGERNIANFSIALLLANYAAAVWALLKVLNNPWMALCHAGLAYAFIYIYFIFLVSVGISLVSLSGKN